jgi:F-type H+-transporting ATPase subunit b
MEIVENIALISINETLIFQLVSFLIFLFILNRIMIRPLRNTMAEREAFLETIEQDIASADETYKEISRQIQNEDAAARRTALTEREKIEAEGQQQASQLIAKTKQEISTMRMKAQKETETKVALTRRELNKEVDAISDQMIAALLGRRSPS